MMTNNNNFELKKQININPIKNHIISSIINEYDISSAHPTALYFIKGKSLYDELMSMEKLQRNIRIGNMLKNNKELSDKIAELILKWTNLFIRANNIKASQFLESTRDSVMLWNKIPRYTTFEDGIVKFVNKEGEYTSYHRLHNRYTILFDNGIGNKRIRIKGIKDEIVQSSVFVKKHLFNVLSALESSVIHGRGKAVQKLKIERRNIIEAKNTKTEESLCIFRELLNENKYKYLCKYEDEERVDVVFSDVVVDDEDMVLDITSNYDKFIRPLISVIF